MSPPITQRMTQHISMCSLRAALLALPAMAMLSNSMAHAQQQLQPAQPVTSYRCADAHGTRYQQWPCDGESSTLHASDARTASQTLQAKRNTERDTQLAASMAYTRKRQEHAATRQEDVKALSGAASTPHKTAATSTSLESEPIRGKRLAHRSTRAVLPKTEAGSAASSGAHSN